MLIRKHITDNCGFLSSSSFCPANLRDKRDFLYEITRENIAILQSQSDDPNDIFIINPETLELRVNRAQDIGFKEKCCVFSGEKGFVPLGKLKDILDRMNKEKPIYETSNAIKNAIRSKKLISPSKKIISSLAAAMKADRNTLYVLSCDGGGIRGYSTALFANLFFEQWGIDQTEIYNYFDVMAGTSTGSILACGMGYGVTPTEIADFFITEGPWIFTTSFIFPSVQASYADVVFAVLLNSSAYSNATLIEKLEEQFGDTKMSDMDTNMFIPSFRPDTSSLVVFSSNNQLPYVTGSNYLVSDAVLASAALPIYLPQVTLPDGFPYQDGGLWTNNPVNVAMAYGAYLKPFASRVCILSLGTGRGDVGFDNEPPIDPPPYSGGISETLKLVDNCIAGPLSGNDLCVKIQASIPFPNNFYYRFQYIVDAELDPNSSDNTSPEAFSYLEATVNSVFESDNTNITAFINHLNA